MMNWILVSLVFIVIIQVKMEIIRQLSNKIMKSKEMMIKKMLYFQILTFQNKIRPKLTRKYYLRVKTFDRKTDTKI